MNIDRILLKLSERKCNAVGVGGWGRGNENRAKKRAASLLQPVCSGRRGNDSLAE